MLKKKTMNLVKVMKKENVVRLSKKRVLMIKRLQERKKLEFLKLIQQDYYMKEINMCFWHQLQKKLFPFSFNTPI